MAKRKVAAIVKIQIQAGAATPAPPVGTALGPHGINIMDFCKAYNAQTESQRGTVIPVEITIFEDRTFTFITKTPPTPVLLRQAAGIEKGSQTPRRETVAPGDEGAGARDRERQDARPQRDRRRGRDGAGRRHRPLDGNRRRRLDRPRLGGARRTSPGARRNTREASWSGERSELAGSGERSECDPETRGSFEGSAHAHRQEVRRGGEEVRQGAAARTERGVRAREVAGHPQLRRDGRGRVQAGCRPPQGRPDAPQHGLPACGHRQGRTGRGVRGRGRRERRA